MLHLYQHKLYQAIEFYELRKIKKKIYFLKESYHLRIPVKVNALNINVTINFEHKNKKLKRKEKTSFF
jgi:hypothetical protein